MIKYVVALFTVIFAVWTGPEWLAWTFGESWLSVLRCAEPARLLSERELARFNGARDGEPIYLSVLGHVFSVEKGRKHYGPGGGYQFFTGRDASRAFVTGDFTEDGLTDDISDFSPSQIVALYDWLRFYQKEYILVGRLIGRFYTESGEPTDALRQAEASLAVGQKLKSQAEEENQLYPACNSEWSSGRGGRVWCSTKSGGVHRDWTGAPRMLFSPGSGQTRCVCVRPDDPQHSTNPNLKEYQGCSPQSESCITSDD